ncbi:MAG: 50S ribosomal protein L3 [Planctomycetes bacterium DG_23]|nr:MAG: 50S ribosomal protein L3 [Planctomycetes bacterium DG_23]
MAKGILGRKVGMTQIYDEAGRIVPVTALEVGPCTVLQVKTLERDGYSALQLGFLDKKRRRANKPELGRAEKVNTEPKRFVREVPADFEHSYKPGQEITVDVFADTEQVDVTGISKGRGFAGVMKRWGFKGGPDSHGSTRHRRPGSIGSSSDPSRVFKGMKMAGHMGMAQNTVKNLKVIKADKEKNLLLVKGAVPGPKGGFLIIRASRS